MRTTSTTPSPRYDNPPVLYDVPCGDPVKMTEPVSVRSPPIAQACQVSARSQPRPRSTRARPPPAIAGQGRSSPGDGRVWLVSGKAPPKSERARASSPTEPCHCQSMLSRLKLDWIWQGLARVYRAKPSSVQI
ncbi:uncharacterized protein J3R85_007047 [Psidium guajava]|nr:uncharacterized protein J3R85_007047 [Psidium guajava]